MYSYIQYNTSNVLQWLVSVVGLGLYEIDIFTILKLDPKSISLCLMGVWLSENSFTNKRSRIMQLFIRSRYRDQSFVAPYKQKLKTAWFVEILLIEYGIFYYHGCIQSVGMLECL